MDTLRQRLMAFIIQHEKQVVFIAIGALIGIGLTVGTAFDIKSLNDFSNNILEGLLPLNLIMAFGTALSVIGLTLFVVKAMGKKAGWLYRISKPVLHIMNEFSEIFILTMGGVCIVAFLYYLPFDSAQTIKSMVLLGSSVLVIFTFNKFLQNLVHGAASPTDWSQFKSSSYWFAALLGLSIIARSAAS